VPRRPPDRRPTCGSRVPLRGWRLGATGEAAPDDSSAAPQRPSRSVDRGAGPPVAPQPRRLWSAHRQLLAAPARSAALAIAASLGAASRSTLTHPAEARLDILYEDNHCIAVDKPAGSLVQPDRTGDATIVDAVREDVRVRHAKRGNVFLVAVHRLDRPVSGVLLLARTDKAASRLTEQFRSGRVDKTYWALVESEPPAATGTLEHLLFKNTTHNRVRVVPEGTPGGRAARLHYTRLGARRGGVLLEVRLDTGRAHQIRVQLAAAGCIIVGDVRYGSRQPLGPRIALHACALAFDHPTRPERITVRAPLPAAWGDLAAE
jgi:23S rRNA pseudouridine1911/1915/1917 synthase